MVFEERVRKKRSLGASRKSTKKTPRSPDLTGQLRLQRHTFETIAKEFAESDVGEVVANVAAWRNDDHQGPYLTVELSPRFVSRDPQTERSSLDFIFKDQEQQI
jgi:hypothetical protein